MKKILLLLALLASPAVHANCLTVNGQPLAINGIPFCLTTSANPLSLPLAQSTTPIFTFLGSFTSPIGGGGMSVCDPPQCAAATMYMSGNFDDPADSNHYVAKGGLGAETIPALTGATPAYDGSNGASTELIAPTAPATYVAPATYSFTTAPAAGAVSGTLTSLPPGIAPNSGWYVQFNGSNSYDYLVTGVSGDVVTWGTALPVASSSAQVSIHQWLPTEPFTTNGSAAGSSGYYVTGSFESGGTVYLTGGTYYDANCDLQPGWILTSDLSLNTWGSVNTPSVASQFVTLAGYTETQYSRRLAGSIGAIPAEWQSLLGGTNYDANGQGLSITECNVPQGFSFNVFDAANVSSAGGSVPVTPELDYYIKNSADSLQGRFPTGPFPETGYPAGLSSYGQYTLTAAPVAGATSFTLAAPFPDNNGVTGFDSSTSVMTTGSNTTTVVASAPTGGWPTSWAANYWVGASIFDTSQSPASACRIASSTAVTAGSTGTVTFACEVGGSNIYGTSGNSYALSMLDGTVSCHCEATFTDGSGATETRQVDLLVGSTSSGTVFSTITGCQSGTCSTAPLTCASGCSTTITLAPLGDSYVSVYSGPFGTEFIEPGSRSLLVISLVQTGPEMGRPGAAECATGASGTNDLPIAPDTVPYIHPIVAAYDLQDIVNQKNGVNPVYTANPYSSWTFPGASNWWYDQATNPCISVGGGTDNQEIGWVYYDPNTNILYADVVYNNNNSSWKNVIDEWSVSPM